MRGEKNDLIQYVTDTVEKFMEIMEGNPISIPRFLKGIKDSANCIRDVMFYNKVAALMNGLKDVDRRKIGQLFAESDYGKEYGFVLLKYIDDFESVDKGKYLAHLLDSLSKEFISVQECFIYARLLRDISLMGLKFIKNNISNKRFDMDLILEELFRYNLIYEANEGGYAFELTAYKLDKYALSYSDKKYKYNGEKDFIPDREKFPLKVASIIISQGEPY